MDRSIQGNNQAWDRLGGGSQTNPGNKMEWPSHTNSRGSSGHRESHSEGDKVGDDEGDDQKDDDRSENRRGGGLGRRCHAYGQQPGQPMQPMAPTPQPAPAPVAQQPMTNGMGTPQQPRAFRRGGTI